MGTLRLRARRQAPRVTWTEDVVDNEGMGKKKSKSACHAIIIVFIVLANNDIDFASLLHI